MGGLGVGSAVQRHAAAPWAAYPRYLSRSILHACLRGQLAPLSAVQFILCYAAMFRFFLNCMLLVTAIDTRAAKGAPQLTAHSEANR